MRLALAGLAAALGAATLAAACRPEPVLDPNKPRARAGGPAQVERDLSDDLAPSGVVQGRGGASLELATLWADHRVVVVFYRGHWCPHCQYQLGQLDLLAREQGEGDVKIVAISSDGVADVEALHAKLGLAFELYADPELAVITKWGVDDYGQGISRPATFVVAPGGRITFRRVGTKPSDHPSLEDLRAALATAAAAAE